MWRVLAVAALACGFAASSQLADAQGSHWEAWPEVDVFVPLTGATQLLVLDNITRSRDTTYRQNEFGLNLDSRISHAFSVRGGYSLITSAADHTSPEHRLNAALTGGVGEEDGLRALDRNRFDLRWIGGTFRARYRNRLRVERSITHSSAGPVTPYAMVEVFYDFSLATVNRIETQLGAIWQLSDRVSVDGGYAHKDDHTGNMDNVNAIVLTLTLRW